jgi:hypothetical protein
VRKLAGNRQLSHGRCDLDEDTKMYLKDRVRNCACGVVWCGVCVWGGGARPHTHTHTTLKFGGSFRIVTQ